jgi:hypothetical protein
MHITNRKNPGFTIVSGTAGFRLFDEVDLWHGVLNSFLKSIADRNRNF